MAREFHASDRLKRRYIWKLTLKPNGTSFLSIPTIVEYAAT
jgi:hypothetical protein